MTDRDDEKAKSVAYNSGAGRSDLIAAALREARAEEREALRGVMDTLEATIREAARIAAPGSSSRRQLECNCIPCVAKALEAIRSRGDAPAKPTVSHDHVPGERPTSEYSEVAIAVARSEGMLRVDKDGMGWINGIEPDLDPRIARHDSGDVTGESSLWTTPADPTSPLPDATPDETVTAEQVTAAVEAVKWPRGREPGFGPNCTCWSESAGGPRACAEHGKNRPGQGKIAPAPNPPIPEDPIVTAAKEFATDWRAHERTWRIFVLSLEDPATPWTAWDAPHATRADLRASEEALVAAVEAKS